MENPKFTIFKGSNQQYYFNLKAGNGEKILASEGYLTNAGCRIGISSVKENAPYDSGYERKDGYNNYTFNLRAANGEIICRSENYTTRPDREDGIKALKRVVLNAPIEDLS